MQLNKAIIVFLFLFGGIQAYAQINERLLIDFYRNQQFNQIKQALSQASPQDTSGITYLFFKTLFIKDGLRAKQNYERVYQQADYPLKQLAAQRLHDYYYALGLYFKASQYDSVSADTNRVAHAGESASEPIASTALFSGRSPLRIQFGAFATHENAEKQLRILERHHISAKIVRRKINGRQLYCVWVNGLKNAEETQKFAEQIKKQLHLDYRIIKP